MTVLVLGAQDEKIAVRETVAEIADILAILEVDEHHIQLHDLGGDMILVHRDIMDLATS